MSVKAVDWSVEEMLQDLAARDAASFGVGFVTTPRAVTWVRREGKALLGPEGLLDLTWAYEVRLFGPDGDLRWKWYQDHGSSTVLDDAMAETEGWRELEAHSRQRVRLLRGSARGGNRHGWTRLWDGQAAPYDIPLELEEGDGAMLSIIEYVEQDPDHGTVDVVAERLVALEEWEGTKR